MTKLHLVAAILVVVIIAFSACQNEPEVQEMTTDLDSASYSLGVSIAQNIKKQGMDTISAQMFAQGVADFFSENDSLRISLEDANNYLNQYFTEMYMAEMEENKEASEAFLEENKSKDGIVVLESGLQYRVIEEGSGESPTINDKVTAHYTGRLVDDTVFDSTQGGSPATFPVNGVIPGWTEALLLMKQGAKWELFIPSELGYGERGAGQVIPPNAALIFDIELISIEKGESTEE